MKAYTEEEKNLIKSLNRPIENINETLISSIVDKLLDNKDFEELIQFFNSLYDFAEVPKNIVDKLSTRVQRFSYFSKKYLLHPRII